MPPCSSVCLRSKPFKTVCIDTVLFFAMFVLVGHLTINCWERYTIKNELFSMRSSLHLLKESLGNIGKAYDNLHTQLKGLIQEVDKEQIDTPECRLKEKLEAKCKAENNLYVNRRNIQVQTTIKKSSKTILDVPVQTDSNEKLCGCDHTDNSKESYSCDYKATRLHCKNASTNTRNPPKSTGTTTPSNISPNDIGYIRKKTCFKDFDDHHSRHVCRDVSTTTDICPNDIGYIRKKSCFKDFDDHRSRHVCHGVGTTDRQDL